MRFKEIPGIERGTDQFKADPRVLKIEAGFNLRDLETPRALDRLAVLRESIREVGNVLVPIEVRQIGDELFVTDGHRRLTAVMQLIAEGVAIESVPVVKEPTGTDAPTRVARMMLRAETAEDLDPLEKAAGVQRLIIMGWSKERVASYLGYRTPQQVANLQWLNGAAPEVKAAVQAGELSATEAINITREAQGDDRKAVATLTAARQTATRQGRARITKASIPSEPKKETPRNQAAVEQAMNLLAGVVANDYPAGVAASVYIALPHHTVGLILDWMMTFEDKLKDKINIDELPGDRETAVSTPPTV